MKKITKPVLVFLSARLLLFLSLPLEGLVGYGDLGHFFGWARLDGWPFLDYWMEFPPMFPFVGELFYRLVGGREHAFYYLLALFFTFVQAFNVHLFLRIANVLRPGQAEARVWTYVAVLTGLFYGWTYFDPLAVCALLLGLHYLLEDRSMRASAAFAVGALIKWFPLLGIAAVFRAAQRDRWRVLLAAAVIIAAVWGTLLAISPDLTLASLRSQSAKGSWETVWALIDGNLSTGNFGTKDARFNPAAASEPQGNPAVISSWITLVPFAVLGAWAFLKARLNTARGKITFVAFALTLFFLWSPGWSPQWALHLLPLVLILFPDRTANLVSILFVLVNLLEWPLLLSRGMFWGLYLTVPLRTLVLILIAWEFWRMIPKERAAFSPME